MATPVRVLLQVPQSRGINGATQDKQCFNYEPVRHLTRMTK